MSTLTPENINILPLENETPSAFADRLGAFYTSKVSNEHKKELGQYFTPLPIAKFIAEFVVSTSEEVKILDPGCGIGILSAAIIEDFALLNPQIKTIELVAFETDIQLLPLAEICFNYLRKWLLKKGIELNYFLCKNDFILHNSHILSGTEDVTEIYDIIVSNPPYFKLSKDDPRSVAAKSVIYGQTNIYSIFLLISAKLLKSGGRLIFITPRSFCSGNYFRMFREQFFSLVDIKNIHLFESRSNAFKRDKVLQETLIISASAKMKSYSNQLKLPFDQLSKSSVIISSSSGMSDLDKRRWMYYSSESLIDMNSYQKNLHLPSSDLDDHVIDIFRRWENTLHTLGCEISTGKIVDFRALDFISKEKASDTVPLFWLHNVLFMHHEWPAENRAKGKIKGQYFVCSKNSMKLLIPNANYVIVRRFSSKDDSRKLIAAPYLKESMLEYEKIGVENHLNYIYKKSGALTREETVGLSTLLNSTLFDRYFRTFNGNINVSATELRDVKLPSIKKIKEIGSEILIKSRITQIDIDQIISKYLKVNL